MRPQFKPHDISAPAGSPQNFSKSSKNRSICPPMSRELYEFGPFRVDSVERVLLRQGHPVSVTPKVFDILLMLVERNGQVVEKEQLIEEIWPGTFVEEGNLTQNISILRKILREGDPHEYIQTVPRRGYRFVGRVDHVADDNELMIEEYSLERVTIDSATQRRSASSMTRGRISLLAGTALVLTAVALASFLLFRSSGAGKTSTKAGPSSIAVVPFHVLSNNANDEFLGLGMTDALVSRLSGLRQLHVRPTSAVRKYAATNQDAAFIGRELQVDSVLDGNIQREGDHIRVTVQLIDLSDGRVIWTQSFDEKFTNILSVEDAISLNLAQSLQVKLSQDEQTQLHKRTTGDAEAHTLYMQGRFNLNKFTEDGNKLARQYFGEAIVKDPNYAEAYAGLAESYAFGEIGLPSGEAFPKARDAATKALALDEELGTAHAVLAQVAFLWDWDWSSADKQFRRALELSPGDPEIHHMYAHYLTAMERFDEALVESRRLLELDPLSPASRNHLGWHYLYAHQFDEAIKQYKLVLAIDPNFTEAHRQLFEAYMRKRDFDDAVAESCKRYELLGRSDDAVTLKQAYARSGWNGFWQKRHELLLERNRRGQVSPAGIACSFGELGDKAQTMEWLQRGYRERDHDLVYARVDHCWDSVRSEQEFRDLMIRMGLAK